MATRFYLPTASINGGPPRPVSVADDASWEIVSSTLHALLTRTPSDTDLTNSYGVGETSTSVVDVRVIQYVSDRLDAQTITGTVKGQIRAFEESAAADMRAQIVIRVVSADGTTVRGTLYASDTGALSSEFALNTRTNRKFPRGGAQSVSSVAAQVGDRLVVELGYRAHNTVSTAYIGYLNVGDPISGSDLPENETDTTTKRPWIEFSQNLVFLTGDPVSDLTDDFNDGIIDTTKWGDSYGNIQETGGRARINLESSYAGYETIDYFDLTGDDAFVQLARSPSADPTNAEAYFMLWSDASNYLMIEFIGGLLRCRERNAGVNDTTDIAFDLEAHRWFRIREAGGDIFWETSTDSTTWTQRKTKTAPSWITAVRVFLEGGYFGGSEPSDYVEWDNFNLPAPVSLPTQPGEDVVLGDWRIMLCDRDGTPLCDISNITTEKEFAFRLNRPASFKFKVPSDNEKITDLQPDGYPCLEALRRTVKAYRQENGEYILRFAGFVWTVNDEGDENAAFSSVQCFDPMQRLAHRLARQMIWDGSGWNAGSDDTLNFVVGPETTSRNTSALAINASGGAGKTMNVHSTAGFYGDASTGGTANVIDNTATLQTFTYTGKKGTSFQGVVSTGSAFTVSPGARVDQQTYASQIARGLIDRANGLSETGVYTQFSVLETGQRIGAIYNYKKVGDALVDLMNGFYDSIVPSDSLGFDMMLNPVESTDGKLVQFNAFRKAGAIRENVIFSWGLPPNNVRSVKRLSDAETVANNLWIRGNVLSGTDELVSEWSDSTSITAFGAMDDAPSFSDIAVESLLDALGEEELTLRRNPRILIEITPMPNVAPQPWNSYWLGDIFSVYIGPRLRYAESGFQRVYGIDISVNDEGVETVTKIIVSPEE